MDDLTSCIIKSKDHKAHLPVPPSPSVFIHLCSKRKCFTPHNRLIFPCPLKMQIPRHPFFPICLSCLLLLQGHSKIIQTYFSVSCAYSKIHFSVAVAFDANLAALRINLEDRCLTGCSWRDCMHIQTYISTHSIKGTHDRSK